MILLYVCSDSNIVNNVLFSLETDRRLRVPSLQRVGHVNQYGLSALLLSRAVRFSLQLRAHLPAS